MKKVLSITLAFMLLFSALAVVTTVNAVVEPPLVVTGTLDLTPYGENAMRVYFDKNITNSETNVTIANVQKLTSADANYDEAVVNGVLDGIIVDGMSIRDLVAAGGEYGGAVHFYKDGTDNFIAVYAAASLINFSAETEHLITITSDFQAYNHYPTIGSALKFDPVANSWSTARLSVTGDLDLTAYDQNAMRIYFGENITGSDVNKTIANIQKLTPADADYDETVVTGVLDGILVDGMSIRELVAAGGEYGGAVHFYKDGTDNFIAVYAGKPQVDFTDGNVHTITLNSSFKDYLMRSAPATTLYLDPDTMTWSDTAPLPSMAVTGGDSNPTFAWGNTMRVLFDQALWVPAHAEELLVDAHALPAASEYYNADAVGSLNDKVTVDGKTIAEWNAANPGSAQVHVGPSENDIRIYISDSLMAFGDGNTHVVTIAKNFISFTGYKTEEEVSLHYDPIAKTWGTVVVVPPTPTPGAATAIFTATPLMMSNNYGTAYFYTTTVISVGQNLNIQAGGGSIPTAVQDAVNDLIVIDGKTVREWNIENDTGYAVMVAFESETSGENVYGRLSLWIDTGSTCVFIPTTDHTVEFREGLIGLNGAPIAAAVWNYSAEAQDWFLFEEEVSSEESSSIPDSQDESAVESETDESPTTSDISGFMFIAFAVLAGATIVITRRRAGSVR
ncbi:MAG: Kelch repeat-containing protein [Saccharofermentanales bacterium]